MKTIKKLYLLCLLALISLAFTGSAQAATLSQTNLTMSVGQSSTVYAYNVSTYISLFSNSNSSVASISLSGNNINIYALNTGSTNATVCENNRSCDTIYITVNSNYNNNNNYNNGNYYSNSNSNSNNNTLGLNISNLALPKGSNATISPSNYLGMYVSNNSNPNVASTLNVGTTSSLSGCANGAQYSSLTGQPCNQNYNNGYYSNSYVSGCSSTSMYGDLTGQPCSGNQSNGNSSVEILAVTPGTDSITFCQSNTSVCTTVYVTVF